MTRKSYIPGDFDLRVGRSATGLGLYAESEIPKGACVIEYVGVELSKEQEEKANSKYLFEIHSRKTIDGAPRWNTARYINHSCRPNCEPNIHKGRVFIHAKRRIKPGEELNYDYGKAYFNEYLKDICACPKCEEKRAAAKSGVKKTAVKAASNRVTAARKKKAAKSSAKSAGVSRK
ncbi:MAG TPA: SET domain-containing protein [Vitreimonas sp.]|uniref:SET domain-containing protein n=1 Tax=Vitreimonas sp. TaxID=3069702 RepID=UPI002D712999|nr:SET domain-containing protein [Vitreimonas sp.]HYD86142.1 SET domain-containing protein [Vitreimonas sp.]